MLRSVARVVAGAVLTPIVIVGCAGGTHAAPPAPTPSATATSTSAAPMASGAPSATSSSAPPPSASSAAPASGEDAACTGADLDLAAVLANRHCRPSRDAPATPESAQRDMHVTLVPSSTKVTPGGHVDFTVEITNNGSTAIPLYFSGDLALAAEVKDAKGKRVAPPAGDAPKASDPKCHDVDCRLPQSHAVVPPNGKAHARIRWDAVTVTWPKTGPTECCKIHVDPVPGGPLATGTYKVRVPLPYETAQGNPPDPEVEIHVAK